MQLLVVASAIIILLWVFHTFPVTETTTMRCIRGAQGAHPQRLGKPSESPVRARSSKQGATHGGMLPVLNPHLNIQDMVQNLVLLEDHLFHPHKRCKDCIRKHFVQIIAFGDEAASLCCKDKHLPKDLDMVATVDDVRRLFLKWTKAVDDEKNIEDVACQLRFVRKHLMKFYGEPYVPV
jgi:hypothetical protein